MRAAAVSIAAMAASVPLAIAVVLLVGEVVGR